MSNKISYHEIEAHTIKLGQMYYAAVEDRELKDKFQKSLVALELHGKAFVPRPS